MSSQYVTVSGCFDLDIDKLKKFTIKIFNSLLRPNNIGQEAIITISCKFIVLLSGAFIPYKVEFYTIIATSFCKAETKVKVYIAKLDKPYRKI